MKKIVSALLIVGLFFTACIDKGVVNSDEKPLAKVGNQYLYPSDALGIGTWHGMTEKDSIYQLKMHVNKWIRDELMLQVAEDNIQLTEQIERMVRDYKATLIMNQYEETLINQRLDTDVTPQHLADYYSKNKGQYISGISWARCHFVKVNREVEDIKKLKKWFKSEEGVAFEKVKLFCAKNNTVHILNEDLWIEYDKLSDELPPNAISSRHRNKQSVLDRMDDSYQYLLQIFEYRDKEDAAPLPQVQEEIHQIIIHQRRNQILQDIRKEVYENAKKEEKFEIY